MRVFGNIFDLLVREQESNTGKNFILAALMDEYWAKDEFAENVLSQLNVKPINSPSFKKIVNAVCAVCGVNKADLSKPSRQRKLSEARGIIAWFVMEKNSATLTKIAQTFNRDLSAISFAVRRIEKKKNICEELKSKLASIDTSIYQA